MTSSSVFQFIVNEVQRLKHVMISFLQSRRYTYIQLQNLCVTSCSHSLPISTLFFELRLPTLLHIRYIHFFFKFVLAERHFSNKKKKWQR